MINKIKNNKLILFILITIWFSLEYFVFGQFSFIEVLDEFEGIFINYAIWAKNVLEFGDAYWLQNIASGADSASASSGVILGFVNLLLPTWIAYQVIIVLHFFLAGYGGYLLCKRLLNLSEISSVFGGVLFSLHVTDHVSTLLAMSLLPTILILLDHCLNKISHKKIGYYFWVGIVGIVYSISSPFHAMLPWSLFVFIVWLLVIFENYNFKTRLMTLFVFILFCFLAQSQAIYATFANVNFSNRSMQDQALDVGFHFFGSFEGGFKLRDLLTLSLAALSIPLSSFKNKKLNVILLLILFATIAPVFINRLRMFFDIQFIRGASFSYMNLNNDLFYSCAAAYCIELLRNISFKNKMIKHDIGYSIAVLSMIIIVLLSIKIKIISVNKIAKGQNYHNLFQNNHLKNISKQMQDQLFRVATITTNSNELHSSYAALYGLEAVGGMPLIYPFRYQQYFYQIFAPLYKKKNIKLSIKNRGSRLYIPGPEYPDGIFKNHPIDFNQFYNLNMLSLSNTKYIFSMGKLKHPNLVSIVVPDNHLCVKIRWPDLLTMSILDKVVHKLKDLFSQQRQLFYIYENKKYLPRFFMASEYIVFSNDKELLSQMSGMDESALQKIALIDAKDQQYFDFKNRVVSEYTIKLKKYTPHKIILDIQSNGDGILIVTNTYSPFWKVQVDNIEKEIVPAYHAFWGIPVSKKDREVVLYYDPPYSFSNLLSIN